MRVSSRYVLDIEVRDPTAGELQSIKYDNIYDHLVFMTECIMNTLEVDTVSVHLTYLQVSLPNGSTYSRIDNEPSGIDILRALLKTDKRTT